jgi:hypothetical protein
MSLIQPLRKTLYLFYDRIQLHWGCRKMPWIRSLKLLHFPPPAKFPMFPSSHLVILFTQILVAIPTWQLLLAKGLWAVWHVEDNLDKNRRVGRNEMAGLSTVKSTTRQHQVGRCCITLLTSRTTLNIVYTVIHNTLWLYNLDSTSLNQKNYDSVYVYPWRIKITIQI